MDGRDLFAEINPQYASNMTIFSIANKIPKFIVSSYLNISREFSPQKCIIFMAHFILEHYMT
jgi:hypothetical protein